METKHVIETLKKNRCIKHPGYELSLSKLTRHEKIDPVSVKKKEINYGRNSGLRKVKEFAHIAGFAVAFRDENALDKLSNS